MMLSASGLVDALRPETPTFARPGVTVSLGKGTVRCDLPVHHVDHALGALR
jgi:hypothetical protein